MFLCIEKEGKTSTQDHQVCQIHKIGAELLRVRPATLEELRDAFSVKAAPCSPAAPETGGIV